MNLLVVVTAIALFHCATCSVDLKPSGLELVTPGTSPSITVVCNLTWTSTSVLRWEVDANGADKLIVFYGYGQPNPLRIFSGPGETRIISMTSSYVVTKFEVPDSQGLIPMTVTCGDGSGKLKKHCTIQYGGEQYPQRYSNPLFVGLTTVLCVCGLILIVALIILFMCYMRYCCKRPVVQSNNTCGENSEPTVTEEVNIDTSHNSAYGQTKEPQLTHDGGVVYEAIRDNGLYGIQPNAAYGPLLSENSQCCAHLYEDPNKVIEMLPNTTTTDAV